MRGSIGVEYSDIFAVRADVDSRREAAERVRVRNVERDNSLINSCLDDQTASFIRSRTIGDEGSDFVIFRLRKLLDHVDQVLTDSQVEAIHTLNREEDVVWNICPF